MGQQLEFRRQREHHRSVEARDAIELPVGRHQRSVDLIAGAGNIQPPAVDFLAVLDIQAVSLAKEITKVLRSDAYKPMEPRGGVMDGSRISAGQIAEVAKWPSREEQISLLVGQILGPGARLAAQLAGPGGALVSQIKQKAEGEDEAAAGQAESATEGAAS